MSRPLAIDLFCGAGGASRGLHQAGFRVVGVDINDQPEYPFEFIRFDALKFKLPKEAVFVWASPPCQAFTAYKRRPDHVGMKPNLIPATRAKLIKSKLLYVIENVVGAPLIDPIMLCGSMFGLDVQRHRIFESNLSLSLSTSLPTLDLDAEIPSSDEPLKFTEDRRGWCLAHPPSYPAEGHGHRLDGGQDTLASDSAGLRQVAGTTSAEGATVTIMPSKAYCAKCGCPMFNTSVPKGMTRCPDNNCEEAIITLGPRKDLKRNARSWIAFVKNNIIDECGFDVTVKVDSSLPDGTELIQGPHEDDLDVALSRLWDRWTEELS